MRTITAIKIHCCVNSVTCSCSTSATNYQWSTHNKKTELHIIFNSTNSSDIIKEMTSFKRPRSLANKSSCCKDKSTISSHRRLLISTTAFFCVQLFSTSSPSFAVDAFSPSLPLGMKRHVPPSASAPSQPFPSSLQATSSRELSRNPSNRTPSSDTFKYVTKLTKQEMNSLFQTFRRYAVVQSLISKAGVADQSLSARAQAVNMPESEFETILSTGYNARQTILLANIPLVRHTVNQINYAHKVSSFSKEDLVQEGTIGLAKAIEKFDHSLGFQFSTYAVYWIRASVLRFIQQKEEIIRVPEYMERAIRVIDGLVIKDEAMNSSDQQTIDVEHVAKITGLTKNVINEAMKVKQRRQLQFSKNEGYKELEEYMMNDPKLQMQLLNEGSSDLGNEGQRDHFKDVLGQFLSIKEMEALSWRYGLLQQEVLGITAFDAPDIYQADAQVKDYEAEAENALFGPSGILGVTEDAAPQIVPAASAGNSVVTKAEPKATITMQKGGRWGESMSFKEVGGHMRVSAEYGRRLCASALKKLKAAADEGRLDPAMLF